MGLSAKEIMEMINRLQSDYYDLYKSNDPTANKKFAFHALLTLKKLKEQIKNARDKTQ
tara:strand:- start:1029 stop:1202 length:174 start_codon:yes stop_codon:yes gene_type:complete